MSSSPHSQVIEERGGRVLDEKDVGGVDALQRAWDKSTSEAVTPTLNPIANPKANPSAHADLTSNPDWRPSSIAPCIMIRNRAFLSEIQNMKAPSTTVEVRNIGPRIRIAPRVPVPQRQQASQGIARCEAMSRG